MIKFTKEMKREIEIFLFLPYHDMTIYYIYLRYREYIYNSTIASFCHETYSYYYLDSIELINPSNFINSTLKERVTKTVPIDYLKY